MRVTLVSTCDFRKLEDLINEKIYEIEQHSREPGDGTIEEGHVMDIKCWSEGDETPMQHALILWGIS